LRAALLRGDKVLVHCAAGLGRTGMLVARLLVDAGLSPAEAIARVRRARPGTIETRAQADFVASDRLFALSD
jgi:protein-tyrosine phosphatase